MLIFLAIVGELATIGITAYITVNGVLDTILEISNNGYKIDKRAVEKYQSQQQEIKKKNITTLKRILGAIGLFTPGYNILNSAIAVHKMKKEIMNTPEIKEAIVPMTEEEKEQYAKMEGKFQKIAFASISIDNDDNEQEFVGFPGHRALVVDHGLTTMYNDELLPLGYTLDEVKRLNDATGFSYRIGKMDGKNVAIIGIPNSESAVSRLRFKSEDYDVTHDYEQMSEEEAQDQTFSIYPFMVRDDDVENMQKIIEEIKESRVEAATQANLDALQVHSAAPGVAIGYVESDVSSEDMMSFMEESIFENMSKEQGPTLGRKI